MNTVTADKKVSFETFKNICSYEIENLKDAEISCFNGSVRVQKFKITIEPVIESLDIYAERLQKLWDESDNHHHYNPIQNKAKELGIELKGSFGSKRKKE